MPPCCTHIYIVQTFSVFVEMLETALSDGHALSGSEAASSELTLDVLTAHDVAQMRRERGRHHCSVRRMEDCRV